MAAPICSIGMSLFRSLLLSSIVFLHILLLAVVVLTLALLAGAGYGYEVRVVHVGERRRFYTCQHLLQLMGRALPNPSQRVHTLTFAIETGCQVPPRAPPSTRPT